MKIISAEEVHAALSYPELVDALQEAFAKEFKTVKVSACRRAGHSHSIFDIACGMYHDGNTVVVLSPKRMMSRTLEGAYPNLKAICTVLDANQVNAMRGMLEDGLSSVSGVIIDVSSMVSSSKMDEIYKVYAKQACNDEDFFFVLLE